MLEKLISKSRVTEIDAGSMRMIGAFKTTGLESDPHLQRLFSELEPLSLKLSASINRIKPSSTLEEADEDRDDKGRALIFLVNGLIHHPSNKIKKAAETVAATLNHYGLSMFEENYSVETSLITSALLELAKPEMLEAIAVLPGCTDLVADFQASQAFFEETRIAWEQAKGEDGTQQSASELKPEILSIINDKIVVYMRAMEVVAPDTHGAFARTLAEIINDNNEVVKKRGKKVNGEG